MCRNIKKLRPPVTVDPGPEDYRAAALQYVRKVSGFQKPSAANQEAFDRAVAAITAATAELLATLQVRAVPVESFDSTDPAAGQPTGGEPPTAEPASIGVSRPA